MNLIKIIINNTKNKKYLHNNEMNLIMVKNLKLEKEDPLLIRDLQTIINELISSDRSLEDILCMNCN